MGHPLRALVKARRHPWLRTRVCEVLSREAEEWLFRHAEVLSEGGLRAEADGGRRYFGSTMISVDLRRHELAPGELGAEDERLMQRILHASMGSVRVRVRALRLAYAELSRRVEDGVLATAFTETRLHLSDGKLHIDVDLEVGVEHELEACQHGS